MPAARFASILVSVATMTVQGQSPCDPQLLRISGAEMLAYQERDRGIRCEGLYASLKGGRAELPLLSLTRSFPDIDLRSADALEVSWSAPASTSVAVRGNSLRYKLYYRMDASAHPNESSFSWPTRVLKDVDIRRRELGVLAWMTLEILGGKRQVYLPVRVAAVGVATAQEVRLEAVVLPTTELSQLFLTLEFLSEKSAKPANLFADKPMESATYPAERAIRVPLGPLAQRGYYHAIVKGTLAAGGSVATDLWFFHEGK